MDVIGGINSKDTFAQSYRTTADGSEGDHEITQNKRAAQTHAVLRWLWHDVPYIAMLLLGLLGVVFKLSVIYWVVLTPVFAVISIASGWRHFTSRAERFDLVFRLALDWCALLLSFYLLSNTGVKGVLNVNATSLTTDDALALGTFVAHRELLCQRSLIKLFWKEQARIMNGKGRFVAYYRVSTRGQGSAGLGIEAQRNAVASYLDEMSLKSSPNSPVAMSAQCQQRS